MPFSGVVQSEHDIMVFLLSGFMYSISKMFHSFHSCSICRICFLLKGQTLKERSPCWEVVSNVRRVVMTPEFPWVHHFCDHLLFESYSTPKTADGFFEQSWASAKYGKATLFCWKFMAQNGSRIYTTQRWVCPALLNCLRIFRSWHCDNLTTGEKGLLGWFRPGIFRLEAARKHHETPGIVQWTSWFDFEVKDVYHANKETRHY